MTISVSGINQQRSLEGATIIPTLARAAYATNVDNGRVALGFANGGLGRVFTRLYVPSPYTHSISGTVRQSGTPVERLVRLTRRADGAFRDVYSDPVTGAFEFDNLDAAQDYSVKAYDDDTAPDFNALIYDRVEPA